MKKFFGEKQHRFSLRKLAIGLVSASISSLFFVSIASSGTVFAQENVSVHYKYVTDTELSSYEKDLIVKDFPKVAEDSESTYYLVYRMDEKAQLGQLPHTGEHSNLVTVLSGGALASIGLLIFAVSRKKGKKKALLKVVLITGMGSGLVSSVQAIENQLLLQYNQEYQLSQGDSLPLPRVLSGYTYLGYIKQDKEASLQETAARGQKLDDMLQPHFQTNEGRQKVGDERKNPSPTNPADKSIPSQDSPNQKPSGIASVDPQDEVLAGRVNKPELLYKDQEIVTKLDVLEVVQENPELAEGTVRVKQEGRAGKKVEVVRIFTVENQEITREILSTKVEEALPRIVEKGTKKAVAPSEAPQSARKGEPETQPSLPEYKGEQSGAIVAPEKTDKPAYTGTQSGAIVEPEKVAPQPEYKGTQAGAIVEPETQPSLPEYKGEQSGAVVAPETNEKPEYTGIQSGAIVEPEQVPSKPSYTGTQSGAIVEPEQIAPLPEYTGNIEQEKPENPAEKPKEKDPEKTLELRNVSDLELYSQTNGTYKQHVSLDSVPSNIDTYFVKVKSSSFKDVYLPVASITVEIKNGQSVYKIIAKAEKLQQELENKYVDNFTFYLAKKATEETTTFTSFSNLVKAINKNLSGTYHLAASLNANEVELGPDDRSYIKGTFTGQLIGEKDGKRYAIYNLKKPLFESLRGATVEKLSLKNVSISGKDDIGSLANEATDNTKIKQVHVDGVLAGERGIGGLLAKADQSSITESSFKGRIVNTYETTAAYNIGGLVGHLTGGRASLTKSKATVAISSNTNSSDQTVGGLAGLVDQDAHIQDSYAEGDINNVKHFGRVAGVAGYLWDRKTNEEQHAGRLTNVLSDVNVTNGNAITGYHYNEMKVSNTFSNKANRVYNVTLVREEVVSKESFVERGTILDASEVTNKKAEINPLAPPTVEPLSTSGSKESDFSKVKHYQAQRALAYKNIEKLLPFYNKATVVKYGNLVNENSLLYKKALLSAVMMKDDQVITDIVTNKKSANKLLLHYQDHSSETFQLKYQTDFAKLAEYSLGDTGLLYTPNQFLYNQETIIQQVLPELKKVNYHSDAIRNTLGISPKVKQTELYLEEQFTKTKEHLEESLRKLLSADAGLVENNQVMTGYIVDKIKRNKEALLLGMSYLERWYNFSYGQVNIKDLVLYHLDFFGKGNASPLDTLIELGKSGFNNLLAKNNVDTYGISLASHHGTTDLFSTLEHYRKVFLPNTSNNDWFKSQTKAFIVEEKSTIAEVKAKQEQAGTKYSIGVYDRITSSTWKYRNMVLPLLTLPERSVFVISTLSSLGFGAYDRYRNSDYKAGDKLNKFVEDNARETAKRQRDHYDYWYRILDEQSREKLYRTCLLYTSDAADDLLTV